MSANIYVDSPEDVFFFCVFSCYKDAEAKKKIAKLYDGYFTQPNLIVLIGLILLVSNIGYTFNVKFIMHLRYVIHLNVGFEKCKYDRKSSFPVFLDWI